MRTPYRHLREKLYLPTSLWATYVVTYLLAGTLMNQVGQWLEIARFTFWWQVITVYVLYMVPISMIFRRMPWWQQYLYGLFPMGLLEFGGYALHSSYAYPHNLLDRLFSERNFSLAMVLFFSAYFPLLNALVSALHARLFRPQVPPASVDPKRKDGWERAGVAPAHDGDDPVVVLGEVEGG
jgi:hypothetical protein